MSAPSLSPTILRRDRLLQRLMGARSGKYILIVGPAGSGKTTLALQWRAELIPYGYDTVWVSLSSAAGVSSAIEQLLAALDQVDPNIAQEASAIYDRDAQLRSIDEIAVPLIRGLAEHRNQIFVFLDDYHCVQDGKFDQFVQTLHEYGSDNLHIAITARENPPLSVTSLVADHLSLVLDFTDLRFNFQETKALLRTHSEGITAPEVRLIYDRTDGWATGLRLFGAGFAMGMLPAAADRQLQNPDHFLKYFYREVISRIDSVNMRLVTMLAVPNYFTEALAIRLSDEEIGPRVLGRLLRENLFLIADDSDRVTRFRFHPLFREILRDQFAELDGPKRLEIHALIGRWFGEHGHLIDAVCHLSEARSYEEAAERVENEASALFFNGHLRCLARIVAALPDNVAVARPQLRLWLGWMQLCYRQLDDCRNTVASLETYHSGRELRAEPALTVLEACLAVQDDNSKSLERLVPALEQIDALGDAVVAGARQSALAWGKIHSGDFEGARDLLSTKLPYLPDGTILKDSPFGQLQSRCLVGQSYLREGNFISAERILRETLAEAEKQTGVFSDPACNAASFYAATLYERSQFETLRNLLEQRLDVLERVALPDAFACAGAVTVRAHFALGSEQEALAEAERLLEVASRRKLIRLQASILQERAEALLFHGDFDQSRADIERLERLASADIPEATATLHADIDRAAKWLECCWRATTDGAWRSSDASSFLVANARRNGLQREHTRYRACGAVSSWQTGDHDGAIETTVAVLEDARRLGLYRTLADLGQPFIDLGLQARDADRLSPSAELHFQHLLAHRVLKKRGEAAADPGPAIAENLSERERTILVTLSQRLTNKRMALVLGLSSETIKWHMKNVFAKLGVHDRDSAVAKARHMGLL